MESNHVIQWDEAGAQRSAAWCSLNAGNPPRRLKVANDTLSADEAFRQISQGTAILWRGDFQNARQLLQALTRRIDKRRPRVPAQLPLSSADFHKYRLGQSQRATLLNQLLLELEPDFSISLRRAPNVGDACAAVLPAMERSCLISLRALQGVMGSWEWRRKGVYVPALGDSIHVHYGVFSPVRGEYVDLVAQAPLPSNTRIAFDIGTGSGVLAAVLAKRNIPRIVASDIAPSALACAQENIDRLGLTEQIQLLATDMFPVCKADLVVCNPPWVPARPTSQVEQAVYDPDSQMLNGFLQQLPNHLEPAGEGWLIMSDLAEHLGLRPPGYLEKAIDQAGLHVLAKLDTRPAHSKAFDPSDPLHLARRAETTSLWRLKLKGSP